MRNMREIIEKRIESKEKRIENAERYLEKGINIEGVAAFHLDDWKGHSGHPKWVRNKMIPFLKQSIKRQEKLIDQLENKEKDRKITERRSNNAG